MKLKQQFTVIVEPDGDGYHAYVPILRGCHSHGRSLDEVQQRVIEAMELHVECLREDGEEIPVESATSWITRLPVAIPA